MKTKTPEKGNPTVPPALAEATAKGQGRLRRMAQTRLQRLAAAKGRNWERMTDDEREQFVDQLLHEDKTCR
ncbi:MAG: hypothetical protein ABSE73_25930 [Planctomycetota bacterium]